MIHVADTIAATLGAGALVLATQPLDTTKVNIQVAKHGTTLNPKNAFMGDSISTARNIITQRGVQALWSGTIPAMYAYGLEHAVLFTVYEAVLRAADSRTANNDVSRSAFGKAICCAASCTVSSFFLAPADAIKCKQQAAGHGVYRNSFHCLQQVIKSDGVTALLANYRSVLGRDSTFFGTYILVRELLLNAVDPLPSDAEELNSFKSHRTFWQLFLAGGVAGSAAWCVATPMDVLNSRRQAASLRISRDSGSSASLWRELQFTVSTEGFPALFRGTGLNVMRGFIGYGVFTTVYMNVLRWLSSD